MPINAGVHAAKLSPEEELELLRKQLAEAKAEVADQRKVMGHILDATLAGFWDWDIANNTEYLSPTFKQMFGYQDDEMENHPDSWQKIIFEEDLPKVFECFEAHVKSRGKIPYDNEVRYHHKDGSTVHVWCRGQVIEWLEDGSPKRMVGSHVDITQNKEAQKSLRESKQMLELIIEGNNAGIWSWDVQSDKSWRSPKFATMLGFTAEELAGKFGQNLWDAIHPDDLKRVNEALASHMRGEGPYHEELRMMCKDGEYRWFEGSGQAAFDETGKPLVIAGSFIDIHERKRLAEDLESSRFLLDEASKMANIGGWEIDLKTMVPKWSDMVYNIHDVPVGARIDLDKAMDFYPPEDRERVQAMIDIAIAEDKTWDIENRFVTAKGREIWVRSKGMPVFDDNGNKVALRGIFQNIDEFKTQELELQKSLDLVGQQNERLLNFAHIVSHNLRSHTGNLTMMFNFMEKSDSQEERDTFLGHIKDTSENLSTTIEHLNEVVQIQTDLNTTREKVVFDDIFQEIRKVLKSEIILKEAEIKTDFQVETLHYVRAYMQSILLNFTSNALKYRDPARRPRLDIRTFKQPKTGKTILEFSDNGLGIDLERHGHKIFKMYKTFHKHEDARGIGLFITKNQIEALGGKIEVESEVGVGTTFRVLF